MDDRSSRAALMLASGLLGCSGDPGTRDAAVDSTITIPDASDGGGGDAAPDGGERLECYLTLEVCPPETPYCCGWHDTGPVWCEPLRDPRYDYCRENPPAEITQAADCIDDELHQFRSGICQEPFPVCCGTATYDEPPTPLEVCATRLLVGWTCGPSE